MFVCLALDCRAGVFLKFVSVPNLSGDISIYHPCTMYAQCTYCCRERCHFLLVLLPKSARYSCARSDNGRHSHLIATGTRRSCMVSNLCTVIAGANSKPATSVSTSFAGTGTTTAPAAAQRRPNRGQGGEGGSVRLQLL